MGLDIRHILPSGELDAQAATEGRLHLRIDPRPDGSPWLADTAGLARSMAEAEQRLAAY